MGKIPLYQGGQRLTTEAPSVRRDPRAEGQLGRDISGAGSAIIQATDTIQKAYNFQQIGTAKTKTIEGTNTIVQQAIEDGENTGDMTATENSLQELRDQVSSGITNPGARARFQLDFDLQAAQTRTKVKSIFWTRMKEKGIANMNEVNIALTTEYAETGDKNLLEAMDLNIDSYASQGFIGADDAQKLKTSAIEKARKSKFIWDINNNFKDVESNLTNNTYGFALDELKNANSIYNTEKRRIWNQNEEELDQLYFDNNLNDTIVDKYVANKLVSPEIGNKWKKALKTLEAANPDPFVFNSMLERAATIRRFGGWIKTAKEKEDRFRESTQLRIDIMNEVGRSLSKKQATEILEKMGNGLDNFEPYRKGILELKGFTERNYTPQEKDLIKQELYRNFMDLVKGGMDPVEAVKKAEEEYINARNPEVQKYEINQVYDTPLGAIKIIGFDEDGEPMVEPIEVK